MPVLARGAEQLVPALGRVAEPEGARGLAPDPAPLEVRAGALRLRPSQSHDSKRRAAHSMSVRSSSRALASGVDSRPGKATPARSASRRTASGKSRRSCRMRNPKASPPAPQPKQWKRFPSG